VQTLSDPVDTNKPVARVLRRETEKASGPKLEDATIIVSGGAGWVRLRISRWSMSSLRAGRGGWRQRAVVDAGWKPYSFQIGQTGKTVKPTVYIALGISGAMQHTVGMKGARTIIAINKDPEAPIFKLADLGVWGCPQDRATADPGSRSRKGK